MTANQIAFSLGTANYNENKRHNQATEEVNDFLAQLEASKLKFQDEWKKKDQYLTESYNTAYINYLNASLEWKQQYEEQMKQIEQEKVDNELYYKELLAGLEQDKIQLQGDVAAENARANKAQEALKSQSNWLTGKQLEYDALATRLEVSQRDQQMAQDLLKFYENQALEYEKLNTQTTIALKEAQRKQAELELEKVNSAVKNGTSISHAISELFSSVASGIAGATMLLKGGKK